MILGIIITLVIVGMQWFCVLINFVVGEFDSREEMYYWLVPFMFVPHFIDHVRHQWMRLK